MKLCLIKLNCTSLAVTAAEIEEAEKEVPIELKAAIYLAKRNIETFHSSQRFEGKKVDTMEWCDLLAKSCCY